MRRTSVKGHLPLSSRSGHGLMGDNLQIDSLWLPLMLIVVIEYAVAEIMLELYCLTKSPHDSMIFDCVND